jgi:DNA invertase Pin-like site-specific DNA recombinase
MEVVKMAITKRVVGVNERGLRVGEDHQNARLTDYEVELLRTMHEHEGVGYRRLAKMFELSKRTVVRICKYQIRNQNPSAFRAVPRTRAGDVVEDAA